MKQQCFIGACPKSAIARGLCSTHYSRGRERGQLPPRPPVRSLDTRLRGRWREDAATGCWLWTGSTSGKQPHGCEYGILQINNVAVGAHRAMYELHHGPIPSGMLVRHTCDTSLCVNPDHLLIGTQADNIRDMMERGRWRTANAVGPNHPRRSEAIEEVAKRGPLTPMAKLTPEQVREIRRRFRPGGSNADLADEFGVTLSAIGNIAARRTWAWLEDVA